MKSLLLIIALHSACVCAEVPLVSELAVSNSAIKGSILVLPQQSPLPIFAKNGVPVVQNEIDPRITTQLPAWAWVHPTWSPLNTLTAYDRKWSAVPETKPSPKKFDQQ